MQVILLRTEVRIMSTLGEVKKWTPALKPIWGKRRTYAENIVPPTFARMVKLCGLRETPRKKTLIN